MSKDKKFNIRIKFNPKDVKPTSPHKTSEPEYIYHWPRIISAVILTLSAIGGGVYFINGNTNTLPSLSSNGKNQISATSITSEKVIDISKTAQKDAQETIIHPTPEKTVSIDTTTSQHPSQSELPIVSENNTISVEKIEIVPSSNKTVEINHQVEEDNTPSAIPETESNTLPLTTQQTGTQPRLQIEPINSSATASQSLGKVPSDSDTTALIENSKTLEINNKTNELSSIKDNIPAAIFNQTKVEIFSPKIKRFAIAEAVIDKEPIGSVENIQFDENNIATVYAYSDAIGFADKFLYYEWRLNGREVARVEVGAWGNRWRSFTHKFIQPNKQGDWSVILEDEAGEKLAIAEFTY